MSMVDELSHHLRNCIAEPFLYRMSVSVLSRIGK